MSPRIRGPTASFDGALTFSRRLSQRTIQPSSRCGSLRLPPLTGGLGPPVRVMTQTGQCLISLLFCCIYTAPSKAKESRDRNWVGRHKTKASRFPSRLRTSKSQDQTLVPAQLSPADTFAGVGLYLRFSRSALRTLAPPRQPPRQAVRGVLHAETHRFFHSRLLH